MNKQQAWYDLFVQQITTGQFVLEEMYYKIEKRAAEGYFDETARDNLRVLAEKHVDPNFEREVTHAQRVQALENRVDEQETMIFELCEIVSQIVEGAM